MAYLTPYLLTSLVGLSAGAGTPAQWIWVDADDTPVNTYAYARHDFSLRTPPRECLIRVTADSRYQLFVNGIRIGRGPAKCDRRWQVFETYDIGHYLREGENVVGAVVHHYGVSTFSYMLGRAGFWLEGHVEDGTRTVDLSTGHQWTMLPGTEWDSSAPRITIQLGFVERRDHRLSPQGWSEPGFDDSTWHEPHAIGPAGCEPWPRLVPRTIPPLYEGDTPAMAVLDWGPVLGREESGSVAAELRTMELGDPAADADLAALLSKAATVTLAPPPDGRDLAILLDMGAEVAGYPTVEVVDAPAGTILDIGYSERLVDALVPDEPPYAVHCDFRGIRYADRFTLPGGSLTVAPFHWKGYRYMALCLRNMTGPVTLRWAGCRETYYTVDPGMDFDCSDAALNDIWRVGVRTLRCCMHDSYEDCPWREQAQWWGDARIEALANYYVFGDTALAAHGLREIAQSQMPEGWTAGVYPTDWDGRLLPDYTAVFVSSLHDYVMYSGDTDLARELWPRVLRVIEWFEGYRDDEGLLARVPGWIFIDWADVEKREIVIPLNIYYLEALGKATEMAEWIGEYAEARRLAGLRRSLEAGLRAHAWDKVARRWVDSLGPDHTSTGRTSQQTNALALAFGLSTRPAEIDGAAKVLLDPAEGVTLIDSAYFSHYLLEALVRADRPAAALEYIRRRWPPMLEAGATTWWETFQPDQSLCHAWSCAPNFFLGAELLGVRPLAPGFKEFAFAPDLMGLDWAEGNVPVPGQDIRVELTARDQSTVARLRVPEGTTAVLPGGERLGPGWHELDL